MSRSAPTLRVAKERDIPELAGLWAEAFQGRSVEERARELREGMPYGSLGDCRLLEVNGRVAAAFRAYRMQMHVRGRCYPTLGVSGVAVAPDFRRRGLGRSLCVEAMREGRRRGDVLSVLYPFRVSFYVGLGYALAGELHHFRFRPGDLPLFDGWDRVVRGDDADVAEVRALYRRVALRSSGMLERDKSAWKATLTPRARLYLHRSAQGTLTGYATVTGSKRRERSVLRVRELVWESEEAYHALLGWLSAQRDQYAQVTLDALPTEGFHRHFAHPRAERSRSPRALWFETARVLRGPMLRLLDVGAVQSHEATDELRVTDAELPDHQGTWRGGKRVASEADGGVGVEDATRAFLAGALPGQAAPPDGWTPLLAQDPFRLLDEF